MPITLPSLPYPKGALAPHISKETLDFHYDKHHKSYVTKLNASIEGKPLAKASLKELITESSGAVFNNAAQVWNHTFYWNCLSPNGGGQPPQELLSVLEKSFGSIEQFKEQFTTACLTQFGSGWAWLVKKDNILSIQSTGNADNPLQEQASPLLTCDVWEHAYYIDYRNVRPDYIKAFWNLVNWDFLNRNLQSSS